MSREIGRESARGQTPLRRQVLIALATMVALGAAALLGGAIPGPAVPTFAAVRAAYQPSDAQLLDRHGAVLHELRVDASRRRLAWVPLSAVSPALPVAVLTAEDRRFREHHGVDVPALVAAVVDRVRGGPKRGASTITMQLASLLDPTLGRGARSVAQKWRQMRAAWALEHRWTKDEILEAYLNLVTYRGEVQGLGAAAGVLFGKAPHGLTRAEAITLAALLAAPNAPAETVSRRTRRIGAALTDAADPPAAAELAAATTEALHASGTAGPRMALAPHVARRLLRPGVGATAVRTTLDADLQRAVTDILQRQLLALRARNVHDGAVLVADTASGDILAYAGSSGPLSAAPQVDAVQARRQPGSALKPFLYALAFERRLLTPASRLDDSPLELVVAGGIYRPSNYDDEFRGAVSARTALASSLNVPAVRALQVVGADAFVGHLRTLGFRGLTQSGEYYGPALALGTAETSLWEMVTAYRSLATGGVWRPLRLAPAEETGISVRVYTPATAFLIGDILADRQSRSWTFGLDSPLDSRFWAAVKTGTSKDMRDNWCIGFSDRVTVGVWVGNASGRAMHDVSGVTGAAPVWAEVMARVHAGHFSPAPAPPGGLVQAATRFDGGVEPPRLEWFMAGTEPPATAAAVPPAPRITTPAAGAVIALDPDIPTSRQRLALGATGCLETVRWVLDSALLGPARPLDLWPLQAGQHDLALVDASGRTVDHVSFRVRRSGRR